MESRIHGAVHIEGATREHCATLLRELRDDPTSVAFRQPVSRKKLPQYYDVITQPMDLKTAETRLVDGSLRTLEEFANTLRLIWRNALVFNEKGDRQSRAIFESARGLAIATEQAVEELYAAAEATARCEGGELPVMQRLQLELFHLRNHALALWFREPVSSELCPGYDQAIAEPMDLRSALANIDMGHWTKPGQVEAGVHLIWTNARVFNGEGSAIDTAALVCCLTWNGRYSRAVGNAPKQRKLRRVEPATPLEQLRLTLLELCRRLPAKTLRALAGALGGDVLTEVNAEPRALVADLSLAGADELIAAIALARAYVDAHPPVR